MDGIYAMGWLNKPDMSLVHCAGQLLELQIFPTISHSSGLLQL